jgi:hypothetical protein
MWRGCEMLEQDVALQTGVQYFQELEIETGQSFLQHHSLWRCHLKEDMVRICPKRCVESNRCDQAQLAAL